MPIKFRFKELLDQNQDSQINFSERTKISRQTINKLYSGKAEGITFKTLEKICWGLGVSVKDLFLLELTKIKEILSNVTETSVVLGARLFRLPEDDYNEDSSSFRYGIGPDDVDALSYITEAMMSFSDNRIKISRLWFPERSVWQQPQILTSKKFEFEEQAEKILKETKGILFIIGGHLSNGFAHYCIETILDVEYEPRGRGRDRKPMESHIKWHFIMLRLVRTS